jgi:predicted DNA-binding protein
MSKQEYKMMLFRAEPSLYNRLRKLSHLTERPMSELIRESLEKTLNDYKKILTNSDIAL